MKWQPLLFLRTITENVGDIDEQTNDTTDRFISTYIQKNAPLDCNNKWPIATSARCETNMIYAYGNSNSKNNNNSSNKQIRMRDSHIWDTKTQPSQPDHPLYVRTMRSWSFSFSNESFSSLAFIRSKSSCRLRVNMHVCGCERLWVWCYCNMNERNFYQWNFSFWGKIRDNFVCGIGNVTFNIVLIYAKIKMLVVIVLRWILIISLYIWH